MTHLHHVVLTKYNAVQPESGVRRPGLDDAWLNRRHELFLHWPLRSMVSQTRAPDRWLIFVDARTPTGHLDRLRTCGAPALELVEVDGPLTDARVARVVSERLPVPFGRLVTTRLDSDDALAADHLERIRSLANNFVGFINPRNGMQLAGGRILRRWDPSSPFLSRVEDWNRSTAPSTVLAVEHQLAHRVGPVRQMGGPPAWLQVVHGGNLANAAQGVPWPVARASALLGFTVQPDQGLPGERVAMGRASVGQVAFLLRHYIRRWADR